MPLSEEEQRILHEMEQKLYEHDRGFAHRVRADRSRHAANRSLRWALVLLIVGFAILILTFRSSLLFGTIGFLVMLLAAFLVDRSIGRAHGSVHALSNDANPGILDATKHRAISEEFVELAGKVRSRFRRHV